MDSQIVAKQSSSVCRVRDNAAYAVERINELTPADKAAGVQGDQIVIFGGRKDRQYPDHPVRLVTVKATPYRPRSRNGGPGCDGTLRIATSRLDLPAELISEIYRKRWLIEVFFRMFKQMLGCRHLLSTKQEGVELQMYCAIIACLLIAISTGCRPNVAVFEAICFYLMGWATLEELEARIAKHALKA